MYLDVWYFLSTAKEDPSLHKRNIHKHLQLETFSKLFFKKVQFLGWQLLGISDYTVANKIKKLFNLSCPDPGQKKRHHKEVWKQKN